MRWLPLRLSLISLLALSALPCGAVGSSIANLAKETSEDVKSWSFATGYGVSTDLADSLTPRIYYQSLDASVTYRWQQRWSVTGGLMLSFTTIDGQVDKLQEDTVYDSTGASPLLSINFLPDPAMPSPWFASINAVALMDSASQREGYLGVWSMTGGGAWSFFNDKLTMSHSLTVSEVLNQYETSSAGTANPGTSIAYGLNNTVSVTSLFSLTFGFGLKQTRYLDGAWDYSYLTSMAGVLAKDNWSCTLSTTNGGYTDEGRVSLWYVDQYRRLVTLSFGLQF